MTARSPAPLESCPVVAATHPTLAASQKTSRYVFGVTIRWVKLGGRKLPILYHDFLPRFLWFAVFMKIRYLFFIVVSALQARQL